MQKLPDKDIRKSVNDVAVAIVGGGLRRYLQAKDELPDSSLSCAAPISMYHSGNSNTCGNQLTQMTVSLGTDIADPLERLEAITRDYFQRARSAGPAIPGWSQGSINNRSGTPITHDGTVPRGIQR